MIILVLHTKTKHIAIKYHYLRELVQDKIVRMEYVNTREQLDDIFTKALPKEPHEYLRSQLGLLPLSKDTSRAKESPASIEQQHLLFIDA